MNPRKLAVLATGAVLIVVLLGAVYGIPARGLIEQFSRDALAKSDLVLAIDGDARVTLWPNTGLTLESVRLRDATTSDELVAIAKVRAGVTLGDLWNGRVAVSDLTLIGPKVDTDALSKRAARLASQRKPGGGSGDAPPAASAVSIDTVTVENATLLVRDGRETAEARIDQIRAVTLPSAGGRGSVRIDARLGTTTVRLTAAADGLTRLGGGQPVPVDASIDAPTLFRTPATLSASVVGNGPVLKLDNLTGMIDQGRLRGAVSVSFASAKPFVDATLDSDRLDLSSLAGTPDKTAPAGDSPWSDKPFNLFGMGLVDANINLTVRELALDTVRLGPAAIEAELLNDVLTVKLGPSGAYGGQASGQVVIDRTRGEPAVALKTAFSGLNALPLLHDAVAFDYIEGRAKGSLELTGAGASPRRLVASLAGRGDLTFENGAIRGIDLPGMLRSLLDMILAGWKENAGDQTRFSLFTATFTVANGVARTTDVKFTGPYMVMSAAGNIDIRAKTLDLRADPRLIAAPQTPGQKSEPWGIGVPVAIQGPWASPRIYADTPNVLADPNTALQALRGALGLGGGGGGGGGAPPLGKVIEGLGKTFGAPPPGPGGAPPGTEPPRDPATLADDIMKALRGEPAPAPRESPPQIRAMPQTTTAPPAPSAEPAPTPAPAPVAAPPPAPAPAPAAKPAPPARDSKAKPTDPRNDPTVRELEQVGRDMLRDFLGR